MSDSAWHHVVVALDRDGVCTWYIDGQVSGRPTDISSESATDLTNTSPLYIGRRLASSYYDGPIDKVAVYKGVVLTSAQVQRHYIQLDAGLLRLEQKIIQKDLLILPVQQVFLIWEAGFQQLNM